MEDIQEGFELFDIPLDDYPNAVVGTRDAIEAKFGIPMIHSSTIRTLATERVTSWPSRLRDESTAYHEAGHAVIALALGRSMPRVSILPGRKWLGRCEIQKGRTRPSEDGLEREILISLAGLAAEARHTGQYDFDGAAQDLQVVHRLAVQRAGERQADRLQRRLLSKVERLLDQEGYWRAVQLIAADLLRCETISGRAARHYFDQGCAQVDRSLT